jgi:hypothetical protein
MTVTTAYSSYIYHLANMFIGQRPSFTALFKDYLAAFNEHNLEKTLSFLSPSLVLYKGDTVVHSSHEKLVSSYQDHWSQLSHPITIHGEVEETEDGVIVVLDDVDRGGRAIVQYHFAQEGGVWLHVRHVVKDVVPLPMGD